MAGLVPAIHVFLAGIKDVDARDERGHDDAINSVQQKAATVRARLGRQRFSLLLILRRRLRRWADVAPGIDGNLFFRDLVHRRLVVLLALLLRLELVRGQFPFLVLERRQSHALSGGRPRHQG
jgi:hypothetical protein